MELHFEAVGQGEPLIILHGLFGSLENWRPLAKRLGENFRVFSLDQRNHGQSPHTFEMDYRLMALDVREFICGQGYSDCNVLGHSMGGKTAMQLALLQPELVERLIVVDMAPGLGFARHEPIIKAMRSLDLSQFQTRKDIQDALAPAVPDLSTRQFLLKNITRTSAGVFSWKIGLEQIQQNYHNLTQAIDSSEPFSKPSLFIRGETSDYLRPQDWCCIVKLFPKATLQTVPAAGHLVHVENPDAFYHLVTSFLNDN
jgi:pimeloyl-ACP methyl ester carboxylesterase